MIRNPCTPSGLPFEDSLGEQQLLKESTATAKQTAHSCTGDLISHLLCFWGIRQFAQTKPIARILVNSLPQPNLVLMGTQDERAAWHMLGCWAELFGNRKCRLIYIVMVFFRALNLILLIERIFSWSPFGVLKLSREQFCTFLNCPNVTISGVWGDWTMSLSLPIVNDKSELHNCSESVSSMLLRMSPGFTVSW